MRKFLTFCCLSVLFISVQAQVLGEWKDYLSFTNAYKLAEGGGKIWCVTEGGLFSYDFSDNSISKVSRLAGLSDFGIKTIAYNEANKLLIVAYKNSNLDMVYSDRIVNLSDIKRKTFSGDKSINNITFVGNEAYLSCGFGIVVINLKKMEIKDTYMIGPEGTHISVFDIAVEGNTIYAATESGIYTADLNSTNLLDYRNWNHLRNIPHGDDPISEIDFFAGLMIIHFYDGMAGNDIYIKKSDNWERYQPQIKNIKNLHTSGSKLVITCDSSVYIINQNHLQESEIIAYPGNSEPGERIDPQTAIYSATSGLWVADYKKGLVNIKSSEAEIILPDGPVDNSAFSLYANEGDIWVASGGRDGSWNNIWTNSQFLLYRDGSWNDFTKKEIPEMGNFWDIVCMVADPSDKNHLFVGSWGGGLLEIKDGKLLNRFNQHNSSLQSALVNDPNNHYTRIGGIDFDSKGNLWISNADVPNSLSVYKTDKQWKSFTLPQAANIKTGPLIVTQNNDKWMIVPRNHNLYVVNEDGSKVKYLPVKSYFNNGETEMITEMNDVYSIAEDHDGSIWVGTSMGVAVYFNPERIWESDVFFASHPGLDLKDGLYHPLLQTETITAIAVDGANRKWMGTSSSGVYLISENGEKEIHHFTKDNSPLLSNSITSIAINQESGEVFIGTNEGIISYQGDATRGDSDFKNVFVYPNPVRESYDGPIVIKGLVQESDVKITDISGNLVYKTTSLGGEATWDGKTLNGNRAKTGVYLVFLSDKTGDRTFITKLLFIN
jgi:ligand-binding sensor domain-containing protein